MVPRRQKVSQAMFFFVFLGPCWFRVSFLRLIVAQGGGGGKVVGVCGRKKISAAGLSCPSLSPACFSPGAAAGMFSYPASKTGCF